LLRVKPRWRISAATACRPDDISAIFGASGAAKWLAIAGLDHKIFAQFMTQRTAKTPVDLFGTSGRRV
jgi:hypothetical protein